MSYWKDSFYDRCASVLNTNCSAVENLEFYSKKLWDGKDVKNDRSYCYDIWINKGISSAMCDSCKDTWGKIRDIKIEELEKLHEYQELIEAEEKFINIVINSIENL